MCWFWADCPHAGAPGARQAHPFPPPFQPCGRQRKVCSNDDVGEIDLNNMGCASSQLPSESMPPAGRHQGCSAAAPWDAGQSNQVSGADSLGKPPRHVAGVGGGVSHGSKRIVPADGTHVAAASLQSLALGRYGRQMSNLKGRG